MELKDLITGAQQAMDHGDYRLVIAASNHALVGYDACLSAHRMLGEAHLERGDQQAAVSHFERTLAIDPLNIVAHLGLGVAAEETKRYPDAYSNYLHAWETNPALDQVRDELVRLRGLLKMDERLHPTRAALAGIHTRTGQFRRAAAEWRAILAGEPESRRARTALAELLWRQGDDIGASTAAREALRGSPENARALAILSDIGRRQNGAYAEEFAQRYAAVDPSGELLGALKNGRSDSLLETLLPESILIDEFNFEANRSRHTGTLARKGITASLSASQMAAPDLWDTLVHDFTNEVPTRIGPTLARAGQSAGAANERDIETPGATAKSGDNVGHHDTFLAAISEPHPDEIAAQGNETEITGEARPDVAESAPESDSDADAAGGALAFGSLDEGDDFELDLVPFSIDQITGEVSPTYELDEAAINTSFGFAEAFADDLPQVLADPEPVPVVESEPVAVAKTPVAPAQPASYVDPFVTADGRIDLTAGWDSLDRVLEAATPGADSGAGFDALLAELDVDGIVPFDAIPANQDEDAWSPFSEVDFEAPVAEAPSAPPDSIDEVRPDATGDALDIADLEAFDVNSYVDPPATPALGGDLVSGIPVQEPSGYTELLRNMDEDALPESGSLADVDPFASPDASGDPLAFDELIEVTSRDGTGPLPDDAETNLVAELDFTKTDLAAAMPPIASESLGDEIDGVAPFDLSAFADDTDTAYDFTEVDPVASAPRVEEIFHADPDVGVVTPFSFDDRPQAVADEGAVDFTELDAVAEPAAAVDQSWIEPDTAAQADLTNEEMAASALDSVEAETDPVDLDQVAVDPSADQFLDAEPDQLDVEQMVASVEPPARNGREEPAPFITTRVRWPQFVAQTSELIDRSVQTESVFARISAQKHALIEMGVVSGGKRLITSPVAAQVPAPVQVEAAHPAPASIGSDPAQDELNEQIRNDLMAMRVRLIEDEGSARDIADMLEQAVGNGLQTPLALRVLGEAYLKLGLVERAAAQFRQAMQNRRRSA